MREIMYLDKKVPFLNDSHNLITAGHYFEFRIEPS